MLLFMWQCAEFVARVENEIGEINEMEEKNMQ